MNKSNENEIEEYLKEKGISYRPSEDHYQMDCFLCSDTRKRLGINKESGKWHCFNCDSKGGKLSTFKYAFEKKGKFKTKDEIKTEKTERKKAKFKPNFHIQFYKRIFKTKINKAARYLIKERGINQEAIKYFKLGSRTHFEAKDEDTGDKYEYDAGEHLAVPYLLQGKCVNLKYRALDPEAELKWRRETGGLSILFNDDVIDDMDYRDIFITESELDTISLWVLGVKNVIGLTTGAEGFKQAWRERLERFERVYLVLDNDEAGESGARKIAKEIGLHKCYNVKLPDDVKDPNDFIQKYSLEEFNALTRKAKQFDVEDSISLEKAMQTLYEQRFIENNEDVIGYHTQFKKVNKILGPLKPGYLVVMAAKPKVGKTTMALNWLRHWADNRINVGMYQCEMRPERLAEKLAIAAVPDIDKIEHATPEMIKEARFRLPIHHMHFYYPKPNDLEIEKVCNKIREMVQRYGIKIFCFDNLIKYLKDIEINKMTLNSFFLIGF